LLGHASLLFAFLAPMALAGPFDCWQWRNPQPHGIQFTSLVRGNGLWVASGFNGLLATSPEGREWDLAHIGTNAPFTRVAFGNDVFITVTGTRGTYRSRDAHAWFLVNTDLFFSEITFGNGLFVAVTSGQGMFTSVDGLTWTRRLDGTFDHFSGASFANNTYFVTGSDAFSPNEILYVSIDGTNWSSRLFTETNGLGKIVYGNGIYVSQKTVYSTIPARTEFRTSTNGDTWTAPVTFYQYEVDDIVFARGKFLAPVPYGRMLSSLDGVHWSEVAVPELFGVSEIAADTQTFVAAGVFGVLARSEDGQNWSVTSRGPIDSLGAVIQANGTYVAVGGTLGDPSIKFSKTTAFTSADGREWTRHLIATTNSLTAITVGASGTYAAVGERGTIVSSPDAINWTERNSGTTNNLNAVTFGNGRYVAVGGQANMATVAYSNDGLDWQLLLEDPSLRNLLGIAYAQGQFVAVGRTNSFRRATVWVSPHGLSWTIYSPPISNQLNAVCYGDNKWVAVGNRGAIGVSSDAITWTNVSLNTVRSFRGIAFDHGWFVAAAAPAAVYVSTNGINWTVKTVSAQFDLSGVTSGPNSFFVVGGAGMVLESGPFDVVESLPFLRMRNLTQPMLTIEGMACRSCEIQATDALSATPEWQPATTVSNISGTITLPMEHASPSRFYRAVQLP
jgi:hypothetical protein